MFRLFAIFRYFVFIYLLAETATLFYFVFICPQGCHFYIIKSYIKLVKLVKISKIICFIRSLNLGLHFHISLASAEETSENKSCILD
jgi:hypothetical protein